jgi:hypothetical protein
MIREIEGKRIFRDTQDRKDFVTRTHILAWPLLVLRNGVTSSIVN